MNRESQSYQVYILVCRDNSLYTGITKDLRRRLGLLRCGRGTRYVAVRRPFALVYMERNLTRSQAVRRGALIKKMSRTRKLILIREAMNEMKLC